MYWRAFLISEITSLCVLISLTSQISWPYIDIAKMLKRETKSGVYLKGSFIYKKRQQVRNGACTFIYPDLIAVPKTSNDVSKIISISRYYNVPISVRSGGHSYTCQSIKPGNKR